MLGTSIMQDLSIILDNLNMLPYALAMTAICLGNEWQIVDNKTNFISLDIGKWLSVYITYIAL